MKFLEWLTLVFITLKLIGVIAWPWLVVCSPIILALCVTGLLASKGRF